MIVGTRELLSRRRPRLTLLFELAAALAGAAVLVGSVGLVRDGFALSDAAYGAVMACVGVGAAGAALASGALVSVTGPVRAAAIGAVLTSATIIPARWASIGAVAVLWALHGAGQSLANVASSRAIVADVPADRHGRAFGAHFAWSHACWLIAYPIAGLLANDDARRAFLPLGLAGLVLALLLGVVAARTAHEPA